MSTQTTHTNKLINEKSPYLLQHAHNPVDWYPWGDEAFRKAKAEDKPVFLSIGYSTCHWCHVMERESFEDDTVAAALNEHFVSIKVDREERPDVDHFYMDACVSLNGSGGWPLSCFLTPDRKPFFAGTYFPKEDGRYGTGFLTVLDEIYGLWKRERPRITAACDEIIRQSGRGTIKANLDENIAAAAVRQLAKYFDQEYGGFGGAPKFPSLQNILFLIRYSLAYNDSTTPDYIRKTLDAMRRGGIYDQIGGGFARYSTDRQWLVPHFEKMMYDNAFHIMAFIEAGALFNGAYLDTVRDTIAFCTREMLHPDGGFFTALDADSEGVEGKFYVFTPREVREVLGKEDGERCCELYHITEAGNFEGKSIPNLIGTNLTQQDKQFLRLVNQKLLLYRSKRTPPNRDDKVMASVNGLMIAALSTAGNILKEDDYLKTAERCAAFVCGNLVNNDRLQSYWRDGTADIPASSDDYAFLIWGLIELYLSTQNPDWLEKALDYTEKMNRLFWDAKDGGYFISGSDVKDLPLRQKNLHDGAIPSGNSVAAQNLLRLSRICAKPEYEKQANEIIGLMSAEMNAYPSAFCGALCADLYLKCKGREIIFVNGAGIEELKGCMPVFSPFTVTVTCGAGYEKAAKLVPFLREYQQVGSKAAAYLCSGGTCRQPVTDPAAFTPLLKNNPEF